MSDLNNIARTYPRQAWVLQPSYKPKEVTIVKQYGNSSYASDWDLADSGKSYHIVDLYPTKEAAIAAGREKIKEQQADIDKRQENLNRRKAALNKAENAGASTWPFPTGGM